MHINKMLMIFYINKINIIPIITVTFESIDMIKQNYFS